MTAPTDADLFAFRRFLGDLLRTFAAEGVRISDLAFAELLSRRLPPCPVYVPPIQRCAAAYADEPGLVHAAALSVARALAVGRSQQVAV